ncbi:MAG TPA: LLM class F420-dependent oxidoreductase [Anaerolineaceae bacterium]|nr:LLM class F420-dependent oxidoreductase [Anaerolineaceae bacterium]
MRIGVVFPQTEIGSDPAVIRDYAQTAEGLGFTHVLAYDHVLGANPDRPGGWSGPYTHLTPFHEVFVLFSYLAGVTQKLELATGILILPQRQTALVAKQAASLDVLSGGRLRLGVGLGWNEVEYIALNENFHNRGKRIEEQVQVLRRLWVDPLVDFKGKWHTIPDAGLNPLPVQRPIPIWFGGSVESAIRRIARYADGWMMQHRSAAQAKPDLALLDRFLAEAGRSRSDFGLEPRLSYGAGDPKSWERDLRDWRAEGATHLSFNSMNSGLKTPQEHIQAIQKFARVALQ